MGLMPLSAQTAKPIKTLIVTGQDGSHYWRGASEGIEKILENSGLFSVDILETPDFGEVGKRNPEKFRGLCVKRWRCSDNPFFNHPHGKLAGL